MTDALRNKLKDLPRQPGVYFHKNNRGDIIYIGKAAVLRNRVRQYFQNSRNRDPKTEALVAEIHDTDWVVVETEMDALFLEAELIRRYMPPYNILLRDDKALAYIRINIDDPHPTVTLTRRPLDDGAKYLGPYFSAFSVRRALKALRKIFPYSTHVTAIPKRACLQAHLGLCPGLESDMTTLTDYRANLRRLMQYLKGERQKIVLQIEKDMKMYAKAKEYERAAKARNQLFAIRGLSRQIIFSDREFLDISKDKGLSELAELLGMEKIPRRIEGYDISHMSGTDNVASMVVFVSGIPDKAHYRKFKMRLPGNDDFAHMHEAITRRMAEKHRKEWGMPNLLLIDGGKGQLGAAIKARNEAGITMPMVGLAKREEEIIIRKSNQASTLLPAAELLPDEGSTVNLSHAVAHKLGGFITESDDFYSVSLPHNSHIVKLLQRIRDESHRFAVSYHTVLKRKRQTESLLDEIPTIGPATRKKLIRYFGSMRGVTQARQEELDKVLGPKKAAILRQYLRPIKRNDRAIATETP